MNLIPLLPVPRDRESPVLGSNNFARPLLSMAELRVLFGADSCKAYNRVRPAAAFQGSVTNSVWNIHPIERVLGVNRML